MIWRTIAARAPLPLLALSAAYGVFTFQALFVPAWVALLSAAAFEVTYLSLAFTPTRDTRRATVISVAAVVVSVLYNTLSSLFHLRPALLADRPLWADVTLAALHGAPLAVVAYAVADLLLHRAAADATLATLLETPAPAPRQEARQDAPPANVVALRPARQRRATSEQEAVVRRLVAQGLSASEAAQRAGVKPRTAQRWVKEG